MKILSAEFVCSAVQPSQCPQESLPEVAFIGRSNVGKSSLINALLRQKGLARTSATPGRTQQINFFRINHRFLFVDLPGYGYAKVPQALKQSWRSLIESYLRGRKQLAHCVLIVDSRIGPTELDLEQAAWFQRNLLPFFIVSTKSDKLSKVELQKSIIHTQSLCPDHSIVAFSATRNTGREQVWALLYPHISMTTLS
ncbi:MAG: ribosome biogenesis GTP-binding protein YihA/YsxC [Acidobacteria bacterium]|nr:ribosome biogenesis GTP-binding protein YihA/YsxC [Acidobacteriota bacterium]MCI0721294.1 ribosome biogenesis GTP-binding protein YihA/YsxC [Acidobacteriota bacterium]